MNTVRRRFREALFALRCSGLGRLLRHDVRIHLAFPEAAGPSPGTKGRRSLHRSESGGPPPRRRRDGARDFRPGAQGVPAYTVAVGRPDQGSGCLEGRARAHGIRGRRGHARGRKRNPVLGRAHRHLGAAGVPPPWNGYRQWGWGRVDEPATHAADRIFKIETLVCARSSRICRSGPA